MESISHELIKINNLNRKCMTIFYLMFLSRIDPNHCYNHSVNARLVPHCGIILFVTMPIKSAPVLANCSYNSTPIFFFFFFYNLDWRAYERISLTHTHTPNNFFSHGDNFCEIENHGFRQKCLKSQATNKIKCKRFLSKCVDFLVWT